MPEGKYIFKLILIAHIKTRDRREGYNSKGLRGAINISKFIYLSRMGSYENRIF